MNLRHPRGAVIGIWVLVLIFAIVQLIAWTALGGTSRQSVVVVQFVMAWFVILVLTVVATRGRDAAGV